MNDNLAPNCSFASNVTLSPTAYTNLTCSAYQEGFQFSAGQSPRRLFEWCGSPSTRRAMADVSLSCDST
jgi:hypothetical protein